MKKTMNYENTDTVSDSFTGVGTRHQLIVRPSRGNSSFVSNLSNGKIAIFDSAEVSTFSLEPKWLVEAEVKRDYPHYCIVRFIRLVRDLKDFTVEPVIPRVERFVEPEEKKEPIVSRAVVEKPVNRSLLQENIFHELFNQLSRNGYFSQTSVVNFFESKGVLRKNAHSLVGYYVRNLIKVGFVREATDSEKAGFILPSGTHLAYVLNGEGMLDEE